LKIVRQQELHLFLRRYSLSDTAVMQITPMRWLQGGPAAKPPGLLWPSRTGGSDCYAGCMAGWTARHLPDAVLRPSGVPPYRPPD